jgi:hypothetical protein
VTTVNPLAKSNSARSIKPTFSIDSRSNVVGAFTA